MSRLGDGHGTDLGNHYYVHQGDCLDVLADVPDGSYAGVITDPPYGISAPGSDDWDRAPPPGRAWGQVRRVLRPGGALAVMTARRVYHRVATDLEDRGFTVCDQVVWLYGTGRASGRHRLRAAHDPIVLACSGPGPLHLNVDDARIPVPGHESGRWPVTVAHDGSDGVLASLPRVGGSRRGASTRKAGGALALKGWHGRDRNGVLPGFDAAPGTAARFFYCAPAAQGAARRHPTEKPVALMRWLVRLLTEPGDMILDPWAGGGTTCLAAVAEGRQCVCIERDTRYAAAADAAVRDAVAAVNEGAP